MSKLVRLKPKDWSGIPSSIPAFHAVQPEVSCHIAQPTETRMPRFEDVVKYE